MSAIAEGDRITIGVTHTILIDGMNSWIKMEINSAVQADELFEQARERIGKLLAANIVSEIERQATVVVEANKAQRH